jgi:hypothetical protein
MKRFYIGLRATTSGNAQFFEVRTDAVDRNIVTT